MTIEDGRDAEFDRVQPRAGSQMASSPGNEADCSRALRTRPSRTSRPLRSARAHRESLLGVIIPGARLAGVTMRWTIYCKI